MSKNKGSKQIYHFVLGRIHSHPGLHVAHGPRVGHPCQCEMLQSTASPLLPPRPGGIRMQGGCFYAKRMKGVLSKAGEACQDGSSGTINFQDLRLILNPEKLKKKV